MDQYFNNDLLPIEAAASGDDGSEGPWFPDIISSPYDEIYHLAGLPLEFSTIEDR